MSWESVPLSEVVSLHRGFDLPSHQRQDGPIPVVGSAGISGHHDVATCDAPGVTIGRSGASIGKAIYVEQPFWALNTCLYATDFHENEPYWVYLTLGQLDFSQYNSGSAQPSLNRNFLGGIRVPRPPLATQSAISEILRALDKKIAANRMASECAAAMILAVCGTPSEVKVELAEVVNLLKGSVKPVSMGDVAHFSLPAFDEDSLPEMSQGESILSNKQLLQRPCILLSKLNPRIPRIWDVPVLPEEPALASTEFLVLEAQSLPTGVLWGLLIQPEVQRELEGLARGTTGSHQRVKADDAMRLKVTDPAMLGDETIKLVDALSKRIWQAKLESRTLAALRDTLLPALMSGRLSVRDAEDIVSEAV